MFGYIDDLFTVGQRCARADCPRQASQRYRRHGHWFCSDACGAQWLRDETDILYARAVAMHRQERPGIRYECQDDILACTKCGDRFLRDLNGVGVICTRGHTIFSRQGAWEREAARPPARVGIG